MQTLLSRYNSCLASLPTLVQFRNLRHARVTCYIALILLLMITPLLSASDHPAKPNILILGDSLSAGYGIPLEKSWVSLLQKELQNDYHIVNASISGETTDGGLRAMPALLKRHVPALVVLELGANDGLRGFPLGTIETNLEKMIDLAEQSGSTILLLGMRIPPNYGTHYAEAFFKTYGTVAERKKVALIPFLLDDIAVHPELMQQDRLHPNEKAQAKIKQRVLDALRPLF